jgi:pimeloyl-ACP methyl ester carboxylesterase
MTQAAADGTRFVESADGTRIAVQVSGRGRPLVLVHGTSSEHSTWRLARPLLDERMTTYAVERRGRGSSGDSPDYSLSLERADLAAVVRSAAQTHGEPADLLGHSFGGNVAYAVALDCPDLRRLVLYEGWPTPDPAHRTYDASQLDNLDDLLADGRADEMLRAFYREIAHLPSDEIDWLAASPNWASRVAGAGTITRELRAFAAHEFDPGEAARIAVPVLLLVGEESPDEIRADPEVVAGAMPDARVEVLPGQSHIAHLAAPEAFVAAILAFLSRS